MGVTSSQTHPVLSYCKHPDRKIKRKKVSMMPATRSEPLLILLGRSFWPGLTLPFLTDLEHPLPAAPQMTEQGCLLLSAFTHL